MLTTESTKTYKVSKFVVCERKPLNSYIVIGMQVQAVLKDNLVVDHLPRYAVVADFFSEKRYHSLHGRRYCRKDSKWCGR